MDILNNNKEIFIGLMTVIITIYVPVGILFLTNVNKNNIYKMLDEHIIIKKIFNIKKILCYVVIYFVILLAVSLVPCMMFVGILGLVLVVVMIWLIIKDLVGIYNWYNPKNKDKIRGEYLSKTQDLEIWRNIFSFGIEDMNQKSLIIKSLFFVLNNMKNRTQRSLV